MADRPAPVAAVRHTPMGRQLPLAATPPDEIALLRFIDSITPIRVFQTFAPSVEELWIPDWRDALPSGWGVLHVWPQSFPWTPEYGITGGPGCPPERAGQHYVANTSRGPVLELSRSVPDQDRWGRLYWSGQYAAPPGEEQDAAAFGVLLDAVWRWVRKHGRRQPGLASEIRPYFLPDAWARYAARI